MCPSLQFTNFTANYPTKASGREELRRRRGKGGGARWRGVANTGGPGLRGAEDAGTAETWHGTKHTQTTACVFLYSGWTNSFCLYL